MLFRPQPSAAKPRQATNNPGAHRGNRQASKFRAFQCGGLLQASEIRVSERMLGGGGGLAEAMVVVLEVRGEVEARDGRV